MVWEFSEPLPDFSGSHRAIEAQRVDVLGNRPAPWTAQGSTVRSWLDNSSFGTYAISPLPMIDDAAGGAFLPAIDHAFPGSLIPAASRILEFRVADPGVAGRSLSRPDFRGV